MEPDASKLSKEELVRHIGELNDELARLRERLRAAEDQSDWMGGALKSRTRVLSERLKELACVFQTIRLLRDPDLREDQRIGRIVDLLPRAWQHPDAACARAVVRGREFRSHRFAEAGEALVEPLTERGERVGTLEVRYLRRLPAADEGPFLKEERDLLRVIAACLGVLLDATPS